MSLLTIIFALLLALLEITRVYFLANYGNAKTILRMAISAILFVISMPLTFKLMEFPQGFFLAAIILLVYPYCAIETKIPKDVNSDAYILREKWLNSYTLTIVLYAIANTIDYII
jgi:hypothetical protein